MNVERTNNIMGRHCRWKEDIYSYLLIIIPMMTNLFLIDKGKQMPMIVNNISRVPQLLQYYDDVSTLSNEPNIYSTNRIWSDMRGVFKRCIRMDRRDPCVFILSYRGWLVHWILPRWVGWVACLFLVVFGLVWFMSPFDLESRLTNIFSVAHVHVPSSQTLK